MPNGPLRITGLPFDVAQYESEKKVEDEEILVSFKNVLKFLKNFFEFFENYIRFLKVFQRLTFWFLENFGPVDQQEDQEAQQEEVGQEGRCWG